MSVSTALSIAGSDPSGGAGIQADLKTFSARGVYGMAAITALTAQNTTGVTGVHEVPPAFVGQQIRTVFDDIRVDAVKIGMIANAEIAAEVIGALFQYRGPVVLDPVMVAKGGHPLLPQDAVETVRDRMLARATVLTPNLPEAAALLGTSVAEDRSTMERQGHALAALGAKAVLIKGGHLDGPTSPDLLVTGGDAIWIEGTRMSTQNTHGTGCTLSSAIASELAKGREIVEAIHISKSWLTGAISAADSLQIGHGHGPTHHFHALWS